MSLRSRHLNGLDGLRALAVGAVVAYHLSAPWAVGGYLGVDLFFVLSGFLITSLLLEERTETSRVDLVAFWRRRARRLLPALYFMLTVVCLWPLLMNRLGNYGWSSINLGTLRNYGISSLLYVTNWVVIATRQLYFAQFALPSPLAHTWSLAIEEQFYLVWPLVTLALLWRGAVSTRRTRGALVCAAVAVASAGLMAVLVHPVTPNSVNYVYNATSTRLFDLAAGAALAWLCVSREVSLVEARVLRWAAPVALLALAAAMAVAGTVDGTPKQYMFDGGFLVCAVLAAIVIAGVRVEGSLTARLFSLAPLMLIGRVSYGIYLWHWPIVTMVTPLSVHMDGWRLLVLRLGLLVALTAASYVLLEQPIRQKRWPLSARRAIAVVGVIVTTTAVVVGTSPANYSYPNPRIATARNAPASPPDGSGSIIGLDQFTWGAANPPSRAHPVTVLSLGDSLVAYAKPGLDAAVTSLPGVRFHSGAGPGFGFSGQAQWKFGLNLDLYLFHPQIVVFTTTWDDVAALRDPEGYLRTLRGVGQYLRARGVHGFFLEGYPMKQTSQTSTLPLDVQARRNAEIVKGQLAWTEVAQRYARSEPGYATYLPINESVEANGRTAFWLAPPQRPQAARSTWDRVRSIDGTHLCTVGVERYGAALAADLSALLHSSGPSRPWWLGRWVDHPTPAQWSNELQGMCPIDHPS